MHVDSPSTHYWLLVEPGLAMKLGNERAMHSVNHGAMPDGILL